MSIHYGKKVTADQIMFGWKQHEEAMPRAFAIITEGDYIAFCCWDYLCGMNSKPDDMPTVAEYCATAKDDIRDELIQTLTEVVNLFDEERSNVGSSNSSL